MCKSISLFVAGGIQGGGQVSMIDITDPINPGEPILKGISSTGIFAKDEYTFFAAGINGCWKDFLITDFYFGIVKKSLDTGKRQVQK